MNNKKANIFLVTALHQFHQVKKAIEYFKLEQENNILFIMDTGFNTQLLIKQAEAINITCYCYKNWIFTDLFKRGREFKKLIQKAKELKNQFSEFNFYMSQYASDFVFLLNNILKPENFHLMDEGTAIFNFRLVRETQSGIDLKSIIKTIIYGTSIAPPKAIKYFTKYNFTINQPSDTIIKYSENQINNDVSFNKNEFLFLGSKLSEMQHVKEVDYLGFLQRIIKTYVNKTFIYVPHRGESKEKLKKIESLGFEIKNLGEPFEDWFEKQASAPGIISSHFYASTLGNISETFNKVPELIGFTNSFFDNGGYDQVRSDIFEHLKQLNKIKFIKL